MIGSILPCSAASVRSRAYLASASKLSSAVALSAVRPLRISLIAAFSACAVTLPASSASLAFDLTSVRAVSNRSTGTKLSPAFLASFSASSTTFAVMLSRYTCAPSPETCGILARLASTAAKTAPGLPPARVIRLEANPSSSSISALSRCSGASRWWLSRIAIVWAACTKPRDRSVNLSKFMGLSFVKRPVDWMPGLAAHPCLGLTEQMGICPQTRKVLKMIFRAQGKLERLFPALCGAQSGTSGMCERTLHRKRNFSHKTPPWSSLVMTTRAQWRGPRKRLRHCICMNMEGL